MRELKCAWIRPKCVDQGKGRALSLTFRKRCMSWLFLEKEEVVASARPPLTKMAITGAPGVRIGRPRTPWKAHFELYNTMVSLICFNNVL